MSLSPDEIQYAEQQIEEANRRLETIQELVTQENHKWISESDDGDLTTLQFGTDIDSDEIFEDTDIYDADNFEKEITKEIDQDLIGSHIQNVIIDCQLSIELTVKAMFKLTGMDHPFSHSISFDSGQTQGFYSKVPDDFDRKQDIVRVIFLTQFWSQFYELAKYGSPSLNVRPEMIFDTNDGSRAVKDTEYCIEVAQELLDFVHSNASSSTE